MERNSIKYQTYVRILEKELVCAMGCTEPIAIAYCAAKARSLLGTAPDRIDIAASGNIIKNVKSVVVPNTGGRRGIAVAAAIGILGGDENAELLVISSISQQAKDQLASYIEHTPITISTLDSEHLLDVILTAYSKESYVKIRVVDEHANIILIVKDGETVYCKEPVAAEAQEADTLDYHLLNVDDIYDFASTCSLPDVEAILERQVACNTAISEEGLRNPYGANIGKVLLRSYPDDIKTIAKASAAAGSDARMSGCEMPVIINSGSGNQGMTASLPVIEYAKALGVGKEKMYRALLISNLVTIHAKTGIGRLSAYCGAISAGAAAGAGIAYVCGADCDTISHTIVNALSITSGIVCDGAKPSCAAKIAVAVDAGILGYEMYRDGQQFYDGEGLVLKGVENSINNIGHLGRVAMSETNREICRMMADN